MPTSLPIQTQEPRERADAARNRRRIVAAAERLFARDGVANVSMDAIAAEAGVGKGTLFRRFGDRASLARSLISAREAEFQDAVIRGPAPLGPGAPPVERLVAFGRGLIAFKAEHAELFCAAEDGERGTRPRGSPYLSYRQHVRMLIEEAGPGMDADYLADVVLAVLSAELISYLRGGIDMPLERVEQGFEDLVRRLLSAPAAR